MDADLLDEGRLVFHITGDGAEQEGDQEAFFTVHARTGDLIQLRVIMMLLMSFLSIYLSIYLSLFFFSLSLILK